MGCGSSKPPPRKPTNKYSDEPPIDPIHVAEWDDGYPAPKPPPDKKQDIFDEHNYAEQDARAASVGTMFDSYEALLDTLSFGSETYIGTARAIFVWLFHADIYNTFYPGVVDPHTPRGYMKLIKSGNGTYEAFFTLLCRAANIPCAILRGIGKGDNYVVGQTNTDGMASCWNAIYLKGSWRLVHLAWAYRNNKPNHPMEEGNGDQSSTINEFFWLTDPPKLISFCLPENKSWQLLKSSWETKSFLQCPQFTEDYYTSGYKLPKDYKSTIISKKGVCSIAFDHKEKDYESIKLSGKLRRETGEPSHEIDFNDFMIVTSSKTNKELTIRFPSIGVYYLDMCGGLSSNPVITKFRLQCKETQTEPVQPFPDNSEDGFFVSHDSRATGITSLSPDSSVVYVKPKSVSEFHMDLSREQLISAYMYHVNAEIDDLEKYLEVIYDEELGNVCVKVTIPEDPNIEYSLQLYASDPQDENMATTLIANYLLVHKNWPQPPKQIRDDEEVRQKLREAMESGNIDKLEAAIQEFEASGIDDDGDLTTAKQLLLQLHLDNLRTATHERQLKTLTSAIVKAQKSCVAHLIEPTDEMEEARETQRQLLRLKLFLHKVMELRPRTISEIHSYPRPRPLVHNVMSATYIILGEHPKNVKSWPAIRNLTKRIGFYSIINRIKRFDIIYLDDSEAKVANKYLSKTNSYAVRLVSAGAGTFFTWSKNILKQHQTMSQELRSRKSTKNSFRSTEE